MKNSIKTIVYQIPESESGVNGSGLGKRGLLLVIKEEEAGDTQQEILKKMITAIQFNPEEDVKIMTLREGETLPLASLPFPWKDLLAFDIPPARLGMQIEFKMNKILHFENQRALFCPSLQSILTNVSNKQTLWRLLQEMFLQNKP